MSTFDTRTAATKINSSSVPSLSLKTIYVLVHNCSFISALKKLFIWFQWFIGSKLWPNNTVNTKSCVKFFWGAHFSHPPTLSNHLIQGIFWLWVPAHHPMQYLGEFLFFHTSLYIRGVWKNTNSPKYCIGWCARATESKYSLDQMKSHCITLCKWSWLTLVTS